jgi:beta-lactamase class D
MRASSFLFVLLLILFFGCTKKSEVPFYKNTFNKKIDLSKYFEGYNGAFVLYDVTNNFYLRYNEEQCKKRLSPCSTFKIPNSLIALETRVATDENFLLKWDSTKQTFESWNRDHTLKSAFANSVVWYYREIAKRIGEESMKYYVQKINYGNMDISGGIDNFWLMSSIEISANEQVEFLSKLYKNKLPFSERTVNIVKDIMILEKTDKYVLRGKTGSSGNKDNYSQGWFVGYITYENNTFIFATNITASENANGIKAKEITYDILRNLKLIQ